ncbi:MAG: proteasome accessory factor PafA2 family protein, partial [Nitrososphaerales archaeon]
MIHSRGRGIEYEIAINTLPASVNIDYHHKLVSQALAGLMKKGYVTKMGTKPSSPNGGVIYDDLAHLEVSTPTYTDPFDAVIYDKVSEVYALGGAQEASKLEAKRVVVHKTNYSTFSSNFLQRIGLIQSELTSYATHGNSTIQRASVRDWTTVLKALIPNYLARIIFMGSGDIIPGYGFVLSPRAMFVAQESSLDTMKSRGIVNERCWKAEMGRNYCDSEKFMRLHDIHYEGLRCDWNVWIRDAWQTYVISAFEKGLLADPPKISDPVRAIRTTSHDHEGNWKIEGPDGKTRDLVTDILRGYYWDKIRPMLEEEGDIADKICIGQIEYMLDKLESRSIETF